MASDIFAKLGDIKGESLDDKHKDEIEVLSYSWGVTNAGSMAHGTGGGEGKATFHDLSFIHRYDKSSPVLMQYCATGVHLKEATITNNGLDHSDAVRVIERFRLSPDRKQLWATQEFEDPEMLDNRGVRFISWTRADDHVHAYDCDPSFAEEYNKR